MNILRSFRCLGCVQSKVLLGNDKTESAVLFRLLTQTIEAPRKKQDFQNNKHTKRKSGKGQ